MAGSLGLLHNVYITSIICATIDTNTTCFDKLLGIPYLMIYSTGGDHTLFHLHAYVHQIYKTL